MWDSKESKLHVPVSMMFCSMRRASASNLIMHEGLDGGGPKNC